MNRYQLAKIVQWAGTLRSRKRMQKMIFLLKAAGCPLDADYDLHHYGPYSQDVARLTDEMVREKLLCETTERAPYGSSIPTFSPTRQAARSPRTSRAQGAPAQPKRWLRANRLPENLTRPT